jgi:hypothetical protein
MANNEGKSQQKVNPVLFIVLGVAVVAFGVSYYLSQPKNSASTQAAAVATVQKSGPNLEKVEETRDDSAQPIDSSVTNKNKDGKPVSNSETKPSLMALNRNPFLTPSIYLKSSTPISSTPTPTITPTPTPTPAIKPTSTEVKPKEPDLRLGGVFQKQNDEVALIYYEGKGQILRTNEVLKGSGYKVRNIAEKTVVLVQDDGKEKLLRIDDKGLKLKGGER